MGKQKSGKGGRKKPKGAAHKSSPGPTSKATGDAAKGGAEEPEDASGGTDSEALAESEGATGATDREALAESGAEVELPEARVARPSPGGVAGLVERVDGALGKLELVVVGFFVLGLTFVAVYQFVAVTVLHGRVPWADDMIRYFVFFTAMSAAALAAQQRRMMAIDIVPRLLSPRIRASVRVVLALLVVFVCVLLIYGGHENRVSEMMKQESGNPLISKPTAMLALPIGAAAIGLHFLFQAIIDGSYLVRGQVPPEPETAIH